MVRMPSSVVGREWRAYRLLRSAIGVLWCAIPSGAYLWLEQYVAAEALRGNALVIGPPDIAPVLGTALGGLIGVAALGVGWLLWTDPRSGMRAIVLHDALLIALLALAAATCRGLESLPPWRTGAATIATGLFAAEGVMVAGWLRKPSWAVMLTVAYAGAVGLVA